jgi:hypothetical protein
MRAVPTTMLNRTMILLLSVMLSLAAAGVAAIASQDTVSEDFIKNNSSISFISQDKIAGAPVDLSAGSGYYSSHPIAVGAGIGSRTEVANANSATSMSHEVGFAQEVSGKREYTTSSISSQGDYDNINSDTTHMRIDESVTSGKVQIGVHAWKDPAIEIEEEYIGTYHISNNFTINNSYSKKSFADVWLNCCGGSYITYPPDPVHLSADDVFNCSRHPY